MPDRNACMPTRNLCPWCGQPVSDDGPFVRDTDHDWHLDCWRKQEDELRQEAEIESLAAAHDEWHAHGDPDPEPHDRSDSPIGGDWWTDPESGEVRYG